MRRFGDERDPAAVTPRGSRQAQFDGFDLHANVWVSANDRAGLERRCRYVLRPPVPQERLRLRRDGRVALELKTAWHDGTRDLVFEPLYGPMARIGHSRARVSSVLSRAVADAPLSTIAIFST